MTTSTTTAITPAYIITAAILTPSGLLLVFLGRRRPRIQTFLSISYITGLIITAILLCVTEPAITIGIQLGYLALIVCGGILIGGLSAVYGPRYLERSSSLLGGFFAATWLLSLKSGGLLHGTGPVLALALSCGLLHFALTFYAPIRTTAIVAGASASGACIAVLGIDCVSRAGLKELWIYILDTRKLSPVYSRGMLAENLAIAILTMAGICFNLIDANKSKRQQFIGPPLPGSRDIEMAGEEKTGDLVSTTFQHDDHWKELRLNRRHDTDGSGTTGDLTLINSIANTKSITPHVTEIQVSPYEESITEKSQSHMVPSHRNVHVLETNNDMIESLQQTTATAAHTISMRIDQGSTENQSHCSGSRRIYTSAVDQQQSNNIRSRANSVLTKAPPLPPKDARYTVATTVRPGTVDLSTTNTNGNDNTENGLFQLNHPDDNNGFQSADNHRRSVMANEDRVSICSTTRPRVRQSQGGTFHRRNSLTPSEISALNYDIDIVGELDNEYETTRNIRSSISTMSVAETTASEHYAHAVQVVPRSSYLPPTIIYTRSMIVDKPMGIDDVHNNPVDQPLSGICDTDQPDRCRAFEVKLAQPLNDSASRPQSARFRRKESVTSTHSRYAAQARRCMSVADITSQHYERSHNKKLVSKSRTSSIRDSDALSWPRRESWWSSGSLEPSLATETPATAEPVVSPHEDNELEFLRRPNSNFVNSSTKLHSVDLSLSATPEQPYVRPHAAQDDTTREQVDLLCTIIDTAATSRVQSRSPSPRLHAPPSNISLYNTANEFRGSQFPITQLQVVSFEPQNDEAKGVCKPSQVRARSRRRNNRGESEE